MLKQAKSFSSFSADDLGKAKEFYGRTLGLDVRETPEGLGLRLNGSDVFIYPKPNHSPASFTVLNFQVNDIEATVDKLREAGVQFEQYGGEIQTDEKGIFRGSSRGQGPDIAWFTDPAGNILSVIQD